MCGIFGASITNGSSLKGNYLDLVKTLFLLSESRGKEASGFALHNGIELRYLKSAFPASDLVKSRVFQNEISALLKPGNSFYSAIGHSRLVTNGYEQYNVNNQPVIKNDFAIIHNGIIVNDRELWKKYNTEKKLSDLDSELIPTLLRKFYLQSGNILSAFSSLYKEVYGMTSIAVLPFDFDNLLLATNNGSLYFLSSKDKSAFVFASERYILNTLIEKLDLDVFFDKAEIKQLPPNHTCSISLSENIFAIKELFGNQREFTNLIKRDLPLHPVEVTEKISNKSVYINTSLEHKNIKISQAFLEEIEKRKICIAKLRRCTKCILPETFPFIDFDAKGECNYCNNYRQLEFKGADNFSDLLEKYRSKDGSPDCLMPFSGGRDSSYALHYVKKELGMNPIAFSYDWGMLTDLARRNQARMCGKLGIEHILVSADIRKKRGNIRKNVLAWLKRPNLGTIPLFMAGDKQYFYFANLLMEQNKLDLSILGENMLETTRFKTGFCGIKPNFDGVRTYSLSMSDKLKMVLFYGKEYLLNPAYINNSLLDTIDSFKSYYVMKHNNVNIFDYLPWEEEKIESILIKEYDWETDPGTKTTWRIGDGTAAFYNYIYYVVAGFSENDTFRSNQLREGVISRETALEKTNAENQPRWDSIMWYCNTIGIKFNSTIKTINEIGSLYEK